MTLIAVQVVTPEKLVWSGAAEMVIARGAEGELGVLAHHAPLITTLQDGPLRIVRPGVPEMVIGTKGGFLEVKADGVTVLADEADVPEGSDATEAEATVGGED